MGIWSGMRLRDLPGQAEESSFVQALAQSCLRGSLGIVGQLGLNLTLMVVVVTERIVNLRQREMGQDTLRDGLRGLTQPDIANDGTHSDAGAFNHRFRAGTGSDYLNVGMSRGQMRTQHLVG